MVYVNRQWVLRAHPSGPVRETDFALHEEREKPSLPDGQVRIQSSVIHCAPTLRNAMNERVPYGVRPIPLGTPVMGQVGGRVVESNSDEVPVGSRVIARAGWQDFSVVDPYASGLEVLRPGTTLIDGMGPLGLNALTAFFGITDVCAPKPGEVLVVSGAAGSTGSVAAQIGKILGCQVVGIAGGAEKCEWLLRELGLDAAIDYRSESVRARLGSDFPEGVDIFYDNVGGTTMSDVFVNLSRFARVAVCGQISGYDSGGAVEAKLDMLQLIYGAITVRGFLVRDYAAQFEVARRQLAEWIESGELKHREDVREGFDQLPSVYRSLFDGSNNGTLLVALNEDATAST